MGDGLQVGDRAVLGQSDLIEQARAAIRRRDGRAAWELLSRIGQDELTVDIVLDKALALRLQGNLEAAVAMIEQALVIDPSNFLALLSKGALLERLGETKAAARVYKNALVVAPPPEHLPEALTAQLNRAREVVRSHALALQARLQDSLGDLRGKFEGEALDRFDETVSIFAGVSRPYVHEPLLLHYPRLPAIPFFDRSHFPWLDKLESATPVIQRECAESIEAQGEHFAPYIARPPGAPVNQWGELNHSRRWSSFYLWRDGVRQEEACASCPATAELLRELPMIDQPGFAPTAMFSVLDAHTHIPPHTGSVNTRLLVHLPLILPGPARFRVGNVTREWRMGEAWVFDDTIEHEAWNDADLPRTILIFDIWNPLLSDAERALVSAMMSAGKSFEE
jgi:aspartyl/asparaginyl beta-hydroxylase (cupin superfamily)